MMARVRLLLSSALVALAGCADGGGSDGQVASVPSGPQLATVSAINDAELRRYVNLGGGLVAGTAAFGGASCAGRVVRLYPGITAVREAYEAYNRGERVANNPNNDIRVTSARRQAVCDAAGGFRFANLPDGPWVVATEIRAGGGASQLVHRLVEVRRGETAQVTFGERDIIRVRDARMTGS